MVLCELVEPTVFPLFVLVGYSYHPRRDAHVLQLPPSFAGDQLVDPLAPSVPRAEERRVLLRVGDIVEDLRGEDLAAEGGEVGLDLGMNCGGEMDWCLSVEGLALECGERRPETGDWR